MRKAELSLETMTPVGRNDSMCTNVFSLRLNDSRYAAVLIGLHGLQGSEGARANVIMHAPKPQTMRGIRDLGSRSSTAPQGSRLLHHLPVAFFFFFILLCNCEQKAAVRAQKLCCNCLSSTQLHSGTAQKVVLLLQLLLCRSKCDKKCNQKLHFH